MASLKAQKALLPAQMNVTGDARGILDKAVLGAASGGGLGTPVATDTIDFLCPAGAEVFGLAFQLDDCDTGAAFVFSVGYRPVNPASALAASANYFAAAGQTTGQAGGRLTCAFKPIKFEEDVYIQIVVGTGPAGITGNPEIHMILEANQLGPK